MFMTCATIRRDGTLGSASRSHHMYFRANCAKRLAAPLGASYAMMVFSPRAPGGPGASAALAVDFAEDGVERTDHYDHVGDQLAEGDLLQHLEVVERGRPGAHAPRAVV